MAHFYSATKYAVTALTEGLRQELREAQTHIRATVRVAWPWWGLGRRRPSLPPPILLREPMSRVCCLEPLGVCTGHRAPGLCHYLHGSAQYLSFLNSLTLRREEAGLNGTFRERIVG